MHLTSKIVPPTCEKEGYTLNICVDCEAEFKTDYVLPLGHSIKETVFAATCTESGYTQRYCECGYKYATAFLPPLGHNLTSEKTEPTCESAGYTEYTCSTCQYSYRGDIISAPGHDITHTTFIPTKDSVGYTKYECNTCHIIYNDDFILYSDIFEDAFTDNTTVLAQGIDVSMYQHAQVGGEYTPLNWKAIKAAGVDFAILKAGSKKSKDPVFEMNYLDAKAAGIEVGAYFYSYAKTEEELLAEIDLLLSWLDGKQFEYPIYFDLEDASIAQDSDKDTLTSFCMTFINALRDNGYYGALYTNEKWLSTYIHGDALKNFCDVWYSRYPTSDAATLADSFSWNVEKYGKQLGMWQYTQSGTIANSGIKNGQTVDFNYAYKDYSSIIKKYNLNGFTEENQI
jgi:GH25 family lysozyme M1 (1,4-beta-N-acetylmuramidase)